MAIFLCAFHLAAVSRVVHPTHLKQYAKATNVTIPYDGKQVSYLPGDGVEMSDQIDMA